MNLELDAVSRIKGRSNPGAFNLDYLLNRIREDMGQRVADSKWQGGEARVVDFKRGALPVESASKLHFSPACNYLAQDPEDWPLLADSPVEAMVINLLPSWLHFDEMLQYFSGSLRPGGLLAFSAFGPDTLGEVAMAWRNVDDRPHIHFFTDMHHLGDMLLKSGFKRPIVDAEWITIEYPDYATLAKDLRYSGFANVHAERRKTLTGKNRHLAFLDALAVQNGQAETLFVTFEIIYGLGFKGAAGVSDSPGQVLVDPPV